MVLVLRVARVVDRVRLGMQRQDQGGRVVLELGPEDQVQGDLIVVTVTEIPLEAAEERLAADRRAATEAAALSHHHDRGHVCIGVGQSYAHALLPRSTHLM